MVAAVMDALPRSTGRLQGLIAFALAAAAIIALSLQGGGAYDIVTRHEAGILLWLVLAVGLAVGVLPTGTTQRAQVALVVAVLALLAWTSLSLTWTSSAEASAVELARVLFFVGVVAITLAFVDRRSWRTVLAGLYFGAFVVLALALLSRLFPDAFPTNYFALQGNAKRLAYPFGYWNAVGCLAAMVVGPALLISASERRLLVRAGFLAGIAIVIPVGYLTYSRGAIAASALAVVIAVLVSRTRWTVALHGVAAAAVGAATVLVIRAHPGVALGESVDGRWTSLLVIVVGAGVLGGIAATTGRLRLDHRLRLPRPIGRPVAAAAAVVIVVLAGVFGPGLADRAWDSFSQNKNTAITTDPTARLTNLSGQRIELWRSALRAADSQTLHGIGPGTFEFWWDHDSHYDHYVRDVHNLYLEALAELGVVGLVLLLAVIATGCIGAALASRRFPDDGAAYALAALTTALVWALFAGYDWMWESTAVTALMLGGLAATLGSRSLPQLRGLPIWGRIAGVLTCLFAAAVLLPALAATSQVRGSEQALSQGDLDLALSRANDAVGDEPWASSPYLQRALVHELSGQLRAAAQDARRAAEREPFNYRPWLILARIEAEGGRTKAALAAYRQAKRRKPSIATRYETQRTMPAG
jgi:tetratricopeptide (TPR) repeat protein